MPEVPDIAVRGAGLKSPNEASDIESLSPNSMQEVLEGDSICQRLPLNCEKYLKPPPGDSGA